MKRISVVGTSGSGKTTLGKALAEHLQAPHIELDALYWEPNWIPIAPEMFRERVLAAIAAESWVSTGNYSAVRDLVWERGDTVLWLDYSLPVIMRRLWRRTMQRLQTREELWNGNCENWKMALSRDSILLWALKTHRRHRRQYPRLLAQPQFGHLRVLHFRSPRETEVWLSQLK